MFIEYDTNTGRIKKRAWTDSPPSWSSETGASREVVEVQMSQPERDALIQQANNIHEAGVDYDPNTEASIGYLSYDAETGDVNPEARIKTEGQ